MDDIGKILHVLLVGHRFLIIAIALLNPAIGPDPSTLQAFGGFAVNAGIFATMAT